MCVCVCLCVFVCVCLFVCVAQAGMGYPMLCKTSSFLEKCQKFILVNNYLSYSASNLISA